MKQLQLKKLKGFTLVELIIVITILAILATIAFVSFQGYTKSARDSNRISTFNSLKKGLDLYALQASRYPNPDGTIVSGSINGQTLVKVGEIQDTISKLIKINKQPKDPLTQNYYAYGVSFDNRYYQIACIKENVTSYIPGTISVYAAGEQARVEGNYDGFIKFNSGSELRIANIPGLIYNNTGTVDLLSGSTYYLVDQKTNLPYSLAGTKDTTIKTVDGLSLIKDITHSSNAILTGVNITTINASNFTSIFTGAVLDSFNINGTDISSGSKVALQTSLFNTITGASGNSLNSCAPQPSYTGAIFTPGLPTMPSQPWQTVSPTSPCYYTCDVGYILSGDVCQVLPFSNTYSPPVLTQGGIQYKIFEGWHNQSRTQFCKDKGYLGFSDFALTSAGNTAEYNGTKWLYLTGTSFNRVMSSITCKNEGVCGLDNSGTVLTTPTNLCTIGTASAVSYNAGTRQYSWTCQGIASTTPTNCSANLVDTSLTSVTFMYPHQGGRTLMNYAYKGAELHRCQARGYTNFSASTTGSYFGGQTFWDAPNATWSYTSMSGGGSQITSITCTK